jgi:hypothetical protein
LESQLFLPAGWARKLETHLDPSARLAELEEDRARARADIRAIVKKLGDKHGATSSASFIGMTVSWAPTWQ